MPLPSDVELAQLLGLPIGSEAPSPKKPTLKDVQRLQTMYRAIGTIDNDERVKFAAEINAKLLPSLIRMVLVTPIAHDGMAGLWWELQTALLNIISPANETGFLQRFLREYPAEGQKLYILVMDGLSFLGFLTPSPVLHKATILLTLLDLWEIFELCLPRQIPSLTAYPHLSRSTRDGLAKLLNDLLALRPPFRDFISLQEHKNLCMMLGRILSNSEEHFRRCKASAEGEAPGSWWRCEAHWDAEDDSKPQCAQIVEGDQMMACSRCMTVRYCSKEHQKLNWRKHKRVCCKTEW